MKRKKKREIKKSLLQTLNVTEKLKLDKAVQEKTLNKPEYNIYLLTRN